MGLLQGRHVNKHTWESTSAKKSWSHIYICRKLSQIGYFVAWKKLPQHFLQTMLMVWKKASNFVFTFRLTNWLLTSPLGNKTPFSFRQHFNQAWRRIIDFEWLLNASQETLANELCGFLRLKPMTSFVINQLDFPHQNFLKSIQMLKLHQKKIKGCKLTFFNLRIKS